VTLEEACAALAGSVVPNDRVSVKFTRVVYTEETLRSISSLLDPNSVEVLEVGAVRWVAELRLPLKGSVLQTTANGRTIDEAQAALATVMEELGKDIERERDALARDEEFVT